jgi:hypothetical protein
LVIAGGARGELRGNTRGADRRLGVEARLVLDRDRDRRAKAGSLDDRDLLAALDRAHELQENLVSTVTALERRLSRR